MVSTPHEQLRLQRRLGLFSATALVVGEVIALGIFLTPATMVKSLGSPMWLLAIWVGMGVMALSGALCYGELAARLPEAGGGYVYLREAYGPRIAFLYGWKSFLIMDPGITAALATGLASYIGYLVGLPPLGLKAVAIAVIAALALLNIRGMRLGEQAVRWLTMLKMSLLAMIVLWGFGGGLGDWSSFTPFVEQRPGSAPLAGALAGATVAAFFSFGGWWNVSKVAGEVNNPARTLPRALALGVVIVTAIYVSITAVFIYLVPIEAVVSNEAFAAQVGEILFGKVGSEVLSAIVIVAVLGSMASIMMTAPRVYYAMARDGLFLASAATIHPRYGTPARAILLQAILAAILVAVGTFGQIVAYFVFVTVAFIALTVASLFVLRRRQTLQCEYMTPGYPVTPLLFLGLVLVLLALLAGSNAVEALLGVGIVALGLPVYHLSRRSTPRAKP
jgi:APA family basic amino acid/polyamine antiporter